MTETEFSIIDDEVSQTTTPRLAGESADKQTQTTTEGEEEEEKIDITKSVAEEEKHLVKPAGVGGAIVGFIFGGPLVSALVGFGAAYAVRKKNGTGDAARALGELTISVQEKAAKIEENNKYLEKSKASIDNFSERVPKAKEFFVSSWRSVSTYTKEKQLIEKGVEGTGKGFESISKSVSKLFKKSDTESESESEGYTFVSTHEVQHEPRSREQRRTEPVLD
eukprot:jgi/Psemu1/250367/estExt_Genewise1Plus.C_150136